MSSSQLTASSVAVPARGLASLEGLRPSSVRFSSVGTSFSQRSLRSFVIKAATAVAPKVFILLECIRIFVMKPILVWIVG